MKRHKKVQKKARLKIAKILKIIVKQLRYACVQANDDDLDSSRTAKVLASILTSIVEDQPKLGREVSREISAFLHKSPEKLRVISECIPLFIALGDTQSKVILATAITTVREQGRDALSFEPPEVRSLVDAFAVIANNSDVSNLLEQNKGDILLADYLCSIIDYDLSPDLEDLDL